MSAITAPIVGVSYLGLASAASEEECLDRSRYMLARALNIGRVVGFIGAGVSTAYGYLTWPNFVQRVVDFSINTFGTDDYRQNEQIAAALKIIRAPDSSSRLGSTDQALLVLGLCQELFERYAPHGGRELKEQIPHLIQDSATYGSINRDNPSPDPLHEIIEQLGIRRFVTTNYDQEIEYAFHRIYQCPVDQLHLDPKDQLLSRIAAWPAPARQQLTDIVRGLEETHNLPGRIADRIADLRPTSRGPDSLSKIPRAFSFSPDHLDDLVQFAVGAPGYELGIFHLHGVQSDPEHLVVTERDYQQAYLLNEPAKRMYRDALNALFAGNAVLFMGTSMEDDDLLRPLREFVSERVRDSRERPLFALTNPDQDERRNIEFRRYLYDRYGVKVIYYAQPACRKEDETTAFCKELRNIADVRRKWWEQLEKKAICQKTAVRSVR